MRFQTEIIRNVKEKRELQNLDDDYVLQRITTFMRGSPKFGKKLNAAQDFKRFSRSKEFEAMKKEVRKKLRESYGLFDADEENQKENLLKALKDDPTDKDLNRALLATHHSSKERLPYYKGLFHDLFAITGQPKVLLDIGCGFNPVAYPFLGCKPQYHACDISSKDMELLNKFFKAAEIQGEAFVCDALERQEHLVEQAKKIMPDVILLFKVVDTLESIERHVTKGLLSALAKRTDWMIVSFATISVGGNKQIHEERRSWFEKFLEKQQWEYRVVEIPNEKFYVIKT